MQKRQREVSELTTERDAEYTERMQIREIRTAKYAKYAKKIRIQKDTKYKNAI